ncbi:class I SAM-dependent methyltransferase, partial [Yersinia aldovae]|uniref:class I SAM-dependent methyltransferase n=1 Tax=Yersinia aldovae TaxID=29483 RepID=UPI00119E828C
MENHQGKYLDTTNIELEPTYIYRDEDIITPSLGKENAVKIMTRYTYFKSDSKQIKIFYYAFTTPKFNRVLHVNKDKYSGLVSIDEGKREYIRKALLLWAEVANIEFIEIPENEINKGDITFSAFKLAATPLELRDSENEEYGSADKEYVTDDYEESVTVGFTFWGESEIWLNDAGNILADLSPQSDAQVTVLHEIGHVLGLNHPFYDNNVLKNNTKLPITHYDNTIQYSLMSYTSEYLSTASFLTDEENEENGKKIEEDDHHDLKVRCPSGPQLYDVATIQYLYGANHKTRTGDDIYGFNGNTGHSFLTLENEKQQIVHCIWDADGNDTLDFSGYSVDQIIDLRPGHFSCVGGLYYNTSIAFNTFIENAIGGSGDDYLKGNKGNNTLKGESGNDELEVVYLDPMYPHRQKSALVKKEMRVF